MRADRLAALTSDDWTTLAGTGIATICDLRSESERAEHPNRTPPQLAVRELPLRHPQRPARRPGARATAPRRADRPRLPNA